MEDLAPPLTLIAFIKKSIEGGTSIREGIFSYLSEIKDPFSRQVRSWLLDMDREKDTAVILGELKSPQRRGLLKLLERGLKKESIYNQLLLLEQETIQACQAEIEEKLTKLPYIMMIPVLFFQFPALLLLILGPLIQNFIESLK
jgi:hypothetical protein